MTPIRYRLILAEPHKHIVRVEATIHGAAESSTMTVHLPVWTPGSYLVREYAQFLSRMTATGDDGRPRPVKKVDKASWQIDCRDTGSVHLSYEVYGHDLGVRNNHIDATHAFLTPTAVMVYPEGRLSDAVEVEVVAPDGWEVFTQLERPMDAHAFFTASDFDELYDSPIEVGPHESFTFEACGATHTVVMWGRGTYDVERLKRDMKPCVEANAAVFGGKVPYDHYLTIVLLTDGLFGGLEHRRSTALMFPRDEFSAGKGSLDAPITDDNYLGFLALFTHEHFHTWHVKRIRPEALGPFDYQKENYTRDIWTIEGITNYYNDLNLLRAGLIDAKKFLSMQAGHIKRLEGVPGRLAQSLEESSYDAWIRLYRAHENNLNSTVSYYLKGHIVAAMIDASLRGATRGEKGLDDVMRYLWTHYAGERGYPEDSFEAIIREATGVELGAKFDKWVRRAEELDYATAFDAVALKLEKSNGESGPAAWIGVSTRAEDGRLSVTGVRADGPAAGILSPGDEIVAIDGYKVSTSNLAERLRLAGIGTTVRVHVFRYAELIDLTLTIGAEPPTKFEFASVPLPLDAALDARRGWIGVRELKEAKS